MPATNLITIEFKPKGDKELIQAINALAKAQLQLENNTKALGREGLRQHESYKKSGNEMRKLSVKLKALGGDFKKAGVGGKLLRDALRGNQVALEKVRLATGKYTASLKKNRAGILGAVHDTRILGGSFAVLRSKLLVTSFAIGLVERTFVSLVKAYGRQEAVNIKLATGLSNVQGTTEGVTQRLIDYSSALQKTTAIGDELITNGMVQLTTFNLNEEAIKALTPQVLNVARAIQQTSGAMPDLNSLFIAFGKSTSTAVSALTRYGVTLTDTEKAQLESMGANERAIAIGEILDKQYGGLAEAYAKTTIGMLEAADVARGDAAEAFGKVLAPMVLKVSEAMKELFEAMTPENIKRYSTAIGIAAVATTALAVKTGHLNLQLKLSRKALVRSGWGVLVIAIGYATEKLLDFFGVFEDSKEVLTDHEKRLKKIKEDNEALRIAQEEATKTIEDNMKALAKELALLYAKDELTRRQIKAGRELDEGEIILINSIIKKTEEMERETEALKANHKEMKYQKDAIIDFNAELFNYLDILKSLKEFKIEEMIPIHAIKTEAEELTAVMQGLGGVMDFSAFSFDALTNEEALQQGIAAQENFYQQLGEMSTAFISSEFAKKEGQIREEGKRELEALRASDKYKHASDAVKEKLEKEVIDRRNRELKDNWRIQKALSIAQVGMDTSRAIMGIWAEVPKFDFGISAGAMTAMVSALGAAQIAMITSQSSPKFARGGAVGGRLHSQGGTMIEAERGEFVMSRSAVDSVGLEAMNRINEGGGGGGVVVNFSGNVMSKDFIEDEAIPQIKEAIRMGADIGIS